MNPGDPEGKKLLQRRADQAEEACRIAECLAAALRRAGLDDSAAIDIATKSRAESVASREAANKGRVESRLTSKIAGHPLLEGRSVNCLYLDESGTSVTNSSDPVFALAGVAMREEDVAAYRASADDLKRRYWGHTQITFHEPYMRKRSGPFMFRGDRDRQRAFAADLRALLDATPFVTFGVAIRKDAFVQEFVTPGNDPYLPRKVYDLAIMLLVERYVDYLASAPERRIGRVHLESIGPKEDAEHQAAYADLLLHGTQFVPPSTFQSWLETGCRFSPKAGSDPAEIADLVARDVFEWARGELSTDPPYWDLVTTRTYCRGDANYGRFGLKVFPASGLEERVAEHRQRRCGNLRTTN